MNQIRWIVIVAAAVMLGFHPSARAQTTRPETRPADVSPAALQLRANEAMAKGDFQAALPMLEVISAQLTNQPDQLGPVLEQIRVCKRNIANPIVVTQQPALSDNRKPHPKPAAGETLTCAIKEMGNFDYDNEKGGNIPDDVKNLDGCKIRTTGYMIPLDQAERITTFALVPSLFTCCLGGPPQVQHTIVVKCPPGSVVSYFNDELTIEGTLHVSEERDGGFIVSIFQIDASSVKPAAK